MEGNELPRLIYVSREKRPGFEHHKKAGAMNALVRLKPFFMIMLLDYSSGFSSMHILIINAWSTILMLVYAQ